MMHLLKTAAAVVIDETTLQIKARLSRSADMPIIIEADGAYRLFQRRRGTVRHIADGTLAELAAKSDGLLRRRGVELRVDSNRVIDRTLRIPVASRPYAEAVVRHQLDRLTPFAPANVVFDFEERGIHGTGAAAEIELRVVVLARTVFEDLRRACAEAEIRLESVGVATGAVEDSSRIKLASEAEALEIARLRERVRTTLSVLLLSGGVAVAASSLLMHFANLEGEDLTKRIETARAEAIERKRGAESPDNPVLAMKSRDTAMAVLVNELSRVIPEDTYLTGLVVENHKVRLTGLSRKASTLIALIEASSLFEGVAFAAPVLRGQAGGRERFEIVAGFGGPVS